MPDKARELGNHRLEEKLGEGAMGKLWLASHQRLACPAALKLVPRSVCDPDRSLEVVELFERKATP